MPTAEFQKPSGVAMGESEPLQVLLEQMKQIRYAPSDHTSTNPPLTHPTILAKPPQKPEALVIITTLIKGKHTYNRFTISQNFATHLKQEW